jgi:uncharacterized membrane protein
MDKKIQIDSVDIREIKIISNEEYAQFKSDSLELQILKSGKSVSYKRHILKTISYRVISTTIGIVVVWGVSGSLKVGTAFGIAELVYKPIQYYIHERVWYKFIKYGLTNKK